MFTKLDPELAHHLGMLVIRFLGITGLARLSMLGVATRPITVLGQSFAGPFGIAAGFDKNAKAVKDLGLLGFSHVEV